MDDFCLHETTKAQLWPVLKDMLATGKRYRVSIVEWKEKRSLSQNSLMWKWNGEVASQLTRTGKGKFNQDDVHEHLKDLYCPPKPITILGETRYVKSTKLLDTGEMTRYLEQIDMWAHQRGLRLTIPARCEYRQLMEAQNA
ncbi:hypothetical protein CRN79_24545 [Serratia fonticola]|uniref:hypothetical protein n=1 Tax=Serratia fonticola TaxID=47917 RepID=UPI000BFC9CB7|nr:hypothetical protein [Serratia fonticola]ATM78803.1 hypothetical protein CRN79_24545 [Serratia fonticola]